MAYEIDYMAVGDGEKAGDAIALRFGNIPGSRDQQTVVVIDGGFKESGEQLVEHIKNYYQTTHVDLVISTHPDADHASGLSVVLEGLSVGQLAMHRPWGYAEDIKGFFKDRRITESGLEKKLEESLQHANELETLANKKGIQIVEPFQGVKGYNGAIHILGPSEEYYKSLLPHFRSTPEPKASSLLGSLQKSFEEGIQWVKDHIGIDLLNDDEDTTSAENSTSAIVLFNLDGNKLLFTGDAGKNALLNAIVYAEGLGISLSDLRFLDVPHHGSRRNLSSKILKKIKAGTAFISAPKDSAKHPAKKVTNAIKKHGSSVFVTRGNSLLHRHECNTRDWSDAPQEPFHDYVEG